MQIYEIHRFQIQHTHLYIRLILQCIKLSEIIKIQNIFFPLNHHNIILISITYACIIYHVQWKRFYKYQL